MDERSTPDFLQDYLRDSIHILRQAVVAYHAGEVAFYRVAALQLRLLLCDSVRRHDHSEDISLLRRIHPDYVLPPIDGESHMKTGAPLTLDAWLEQPLYGQNGQALCVRQFIRRVCDQDGGAHVDPKPQTGLAVFPHRADLIIRLAVTLIDHLPGEGASNSTDQ